MSFIRKNTVIVQMFGFVLLLLALTMWTGGCTLGDCDLGEREICVGSDCVCGDKCATDDNCTKPDPAGGYQRCFAYEFTPEHGVCVNAKYLDDHGWDRNLPIPLVPDVGL